MHPDPEQHGGMLTLYLSITGGLSWESALRPLQEALGWGWGMDGMDTTWDMGEIIEKEMETTIYDISISQIFINLSF